MIKHTASACALYAMAPHQSTMTDSYGLESGRVSHGDAGASKDRGGIGGIGIGIGVGIRLARPCVVRYALRSAICNDSKGRRKLETWRLANT